MITLAIDPGVHKHACALFVGTHLAEVGWNLRYDNVQSVAIEKPQFDGRPATALIDLAWAGALFAGSFGVPVRAFEPREWKKSVPKPIHHGRIWDALTNQEIDLLPDDTLGRLHAARAKLAKRPGKPGAYYYGNWEWHNILDAIGIGLYAVGRRFQ